MQRVINIYEQFECRAGRCQNSCCKSWKIALDDTTIGEYRRAAGLRGLIGRLTGIRKDSDGNICLNMINGDCIFHDRDGLCRHQRNKNMELMPLICRVYPRRNISFCGRKEAVLELACEEASQIFVDFVLDGNRIALVESDIETPVYWMMLDADSELVENIECARNVFIGFIFDTLQGSVRVEDIFDLMKNIYSRAFVIQKMYEQNMSASVGEYIRNGMKQGDVLAGFLDMKLLLDSLKDRSLENSGHSFEYFYSVIGNIDRIREDVEFDEQMTSLVANYFAYQLIKRMPECAEDFYFLRVITLAIVNTITFVLFATECSPMRSAKELLAKDGAIDRKELSGNAYIYNEKLADIISSIERVLSHSPSFENRLINSLAQNK